MKKFIVVALIALTAISFGYELSFAMSGPGYPGDILGMSTGRQASDPHRTFRFVRYKGNAYYTGKCTAGTPVCWNITEDDGVTVTTAGTISNDSAYAGVVVTDITSYDVLATTTSSVNTYTAEDDQGRRNWGFLQTYGLCTVTGIGATQITAGNAVGITGSTSTTALPGVTNFVASTSIPSCNGKLGFACETGTYSATSEIDVFLQCE